ncbi:Early endosome antigen 1 [Dirofilaria immitis]|nr:Early endosome antigen 1 [Dirofilaria immitis]
MLRKLKQQVTQAVSNVSPSEVHPPPIFIDAFQHEPSFNESDTSSEGFLCPVCMHPFSSPDELQIHFQVHAIQQVRKQELSASSSFNLSGNSFNESNIVHLELDMKELRSQLQDEKRYSIELKKELNRLHGLISNKAEISENEIPYLTQQVQMLEAGKALATERMLEMEKETSGLKRQVEQLKQEKNRPSEDDVNVLRKELIHAQQLMDAIAQEKEKEIKKDIDTIRNLKEDRKRFDSGSKELIEEIDAFRIIWEEKAANSAEQISEVCKKIRDLEIAVSECRRKIVDNEIQKNRVSKFEDVKSLLKVSQESGKCEEELCQNNSALEMTMSRTGEEMEAIEKEETIVEYRKEIEQLKKNISILKTCLTEASVSEDILKQSLKEARAKELLLMQEISEGGGAENLAIEQIIKEKKALEETVNELNEILKSLNISHENAISKHEESWKKKVDDEKKKLAAMLKEKTKTAEEMNEIIGTERIKLKLVAEKLTLTDEKMRQLDNELQKKEAMANRFNEECTKLEEMVKNMRSELKDVEIAKKQLQEALSICRQEKCTLKEQLENVLQQCSALELEEKINNLVAKLEYEKQNRDESIKDVQCKLNQIQQDNIAMLTAKEREIATQSKTISELKEELYAKQKQLSDVLQKMENVHNKLRLKDEERSILENEVLKLNKQNSELREKMDDLGKCVLQLENDFEKETNLLKNNLEKCEKDKEESVLKLHVQLETEQRRLKEASKDIEEKNENLKQMKENLNELKIIQRTDLFLVMYLSADLEKRKTEWLQEKRALQERCLTAENDLEFERERAIVNKRNFDDVQTAIRELGQVNQNLQMDFAKQVSRKWLEDSEAINCRACDKPFTLTNRKHHCRQCGQIFCASCSSFTAKIASSRSSVRVCNACHEEIMHR